MKKMGWFLLALSLFLFYGPILLSARSVVTSIEGDPTGHMLISLGDPRPGGRFFHYFDLSANARLWGNDVKYNPLHLIRLVSIALGANLIGWGILILGVHSLLFLTVVYYSRKVLRVSEAASLAGAAVVFFATSWLEWTALVYWSAGATLLAVSVGEYGLFLETGRRRHLFFCVLANALQPYVTQSQALIPTQTYLLGAVLLMSLSRKGSLRSGLLPLALRVWPLTVLGWLPIFLPMLFLIFSGLVSRESLRPLAWGLHAAPVTQFLGFLSPIPFAVQILWDKLRLGAFLWPPDSYLFGSFLFLPALLALWQSGRKPLRLLVVGTALYCATILLDSAVSTPSALIEDIGFSRLFAFPLLSGFVVAAAFDLPAFCSPATRGMKTLNAFHKVLLFLSVIGGIALFGIGEERLARIVSRMGLIGTGTAFHALFFSTGLFAAGIAVGLTAYFRFIRGRRLWALMAAVLAPALCFGVGMGWTQRPPELDAMLSPPAELEFVRKQIPGYSYRVGLLVSSEMRLARGDWGRFWKETGRQEEAILFNLRENDLRLRQGLAFALPPLHFFGPTHNLLRREGNPFLKRFDLPERQFLRYRNVIVRPEAEVFEEYGVRYWISDFDLQNLSPGKFTRLFQGRTAAVFEDREAKPVAFFADDPTGALQLKQTADGAAILFPAPRGGRLSISLDLRCMKGRSTAPGGVSSPLALEPSGIRWLAEVPPGSSSVVLTPREAPLLKAVAAASAVAFLLLSALAVHLL